MHHLSYQGMALQETLCFLHRGGAAVLPVALCHRQHPALFLPIIFPADALKKKKEINGLLLIPVSGVQPVLPIQKSEFSIFISSGC